MKRLHKVLIAVVTLVISMLVVPCLIVSLAPHNWGMALCFLMFFVIDPLVVITFGIMAGTDIKYLWFIPLIAALLFPPFFAIAIKEWVIELFVYAGFYLCIGVASMLGTHYGMKIKSKTRGNDHDIRIKKY